MANAQSRFEEDIETAHARREERARERIPGLVAKLDEAREKLRVAASNAVRRDHSRSVNRYERELKEALIEQRYTRVCSEAANAALDAMEKAL